MYRLSRHFSLASLTSIVLATLAITLVYRHMAVTGMAHLSKKINLEVVDTALNPIQPRLLAYLSTVANMDKPRVGFTPYHSAAFEQVVESIMQDVAVTRIKIYNQHGVVVYSTRPIDIGKAAGALGNNNESRGVASALKGKIQHALIHRDAFNLLGSPTKSDNLMQTYVPLRRTATSPVLGVFEVYTDITPLVEYAQYTQIAVAAVTAAIMAVLYLILVAYVRRADKIIVSQQGTIRERTETLQLLSAQLLTSQENEKKRVANELNEEIAQILSAVKFQIEHAARVAERRSVDSSARTLASAVGAIQDAIRKLNAIAMDLRPTSLDDLGVIATVDWYARKFRSRYPGIALELDFRIEEKQVSQPLKVIIYRIIQEMLDNLARYSVATRIRMSLVKADNAIALSIENDARLHHPGDSPAEGKHENWTWRHTVEERAVLAGGTVSTENGDAGAFRIRFAWAA
jgi:signal transduction histidine kinase